MLDLYFINRLVKSSGNGKFLDSEITLWPLLGVGAKKSHFLGDPFLFFPCIESHDS